MMEIPGRGRLLLPTHLAAMTGALLLVGGLAAQGRSGKDLDPLRDFEREQSRIQSRIEKRMKDLERRIQSLQKRLEKERLGLVQGGKSKVIERSSMSELKMRIGKDGVRVEFQEKGPDGKMKKRVYEDKDLRSLLRAHPELKKRISVGGGLGGLDFPNFDFDFDFMGPKGGAMPFPKGFPMGLGSIRDFIQEMQRMFGEDFLMDFGPWGQARIRIGGRGNGTPLPPKPGSFPGKGHVKVFKNDGEVRVEIRTPNGARVFEGKSIEDLLRKHPELKGTIRKGTHGKGDRKKHGLEPEFRNPPMKGGVQDWVSPQGNEGPKLGIYLDGRGLNPALREYLDIPEGAGLLVDGVVKGSLAERMGMRKKDILLRLNGRLIKGPRDVAKILEDVEEDAPVKAEVLRRGREVVLKARK